MSEINSIIKYYNRIVVRGIIIEFVIGLAVLSILHYADFSIYLIIPLIISSLVTFLFTANENYLIQYESTSSNELRIKYFNFLDKVVTEDIAFDKILKIKDNNKTEVIIVFKDNRILKLNRKKFRNNEVI